MFICEECKRNQAEAFSLLCKACYDDREDMGVREPRREKSYGQILLEIAERHNGRDFAQNCY